MLILALLLQAAEIPAAPSEPPAPVGSPTAAPVTSDDGFIVGVDTFETVREKLGKPQFTSLNSDGTRIAAFTTSRARVKGTTFIPIVGLFAGGAKSNVTVKTFVFGKDGKLTSFSGSEANSNCNTSIGSVSCK